MYAHYPQTSGARPLSVATAVCLHATPGSAPASGPRVACQCDHADHADHKDLAPMSNSNRQASVA